MRYLLWPFLRVAALVLLVLVTIWVLEGSAEGFDGANQIPAADFRLLAPVSYFANICADNGNLPYLGSPLS